MTQQHQDDQPPWGAQQQLTQPPPQQAWGTPLATTPRPAQPRQKRGWGLGIAGLAVGLFLGYAAWGVDTSPTPPAAAPATTARAKQGAAQPATTQAPKPAAAAPAPATPRVLLNLTGSGVKRTRTFTVRDGSWEVRWTNQTSDYFGIYVEDPSGSPVGVAANTTDRGSDVWPGVQPGTYYLEVNATGRWAVQVVDTP